MEYALDCLGLELQRLAILKGHEKEQAELLAAIQVLTMGQGYLTQKPPVKIIFYQDVQP